MGLKQERANETASRPTPLKSDPCGIETFKTCHCSSGIGQLKSDPCGIETCENVSKRYRMVLLKSDPCGIETDIVNPDDITFDG